MINVLLQITLLSSRW